MADSVAEDAGILPLLMPYITAPFILSSSKLSRRRLFGVWLSQAKTLGLLRLNRSSNIERGISFVVLSTL